MSNKSGTSSQIISLPTGGGAMHGIGETFSPDLFSGTGNFAISLSLPPGRNDFQPDLSLSYNTGNGNGPFGLGWNINIPGVTRKTSKGVPLYRDDASNPKDRDTYILSGSEDLVQITERAQGVAEYRPRIEGVFARIENIQDAENDFWRVRSKDGKISLYGTAESAESDPAAISDPQDFSKVFCWKLSQTTDPFGNRIEYKYIRDRGQEGPHDWDQLYLEEVKYIDFDKNGDTQFLASVTLIYEERPDPYSMYRSGFEVRTRLRCKKIEVRTHPEQDILVRTYELLYLDDLVSSGELSESSLPPNGISILGQVKVMGHDGNETQELPPLQFGYTDFDPANSAIQSLSAINNSLPENSLGNDDFEMIDLFGDGLPDIVQMNGVAQFWRNLGDGVFDMPTTMDEVPAGTQLQQPGVRLCDLNGNARSDLLVSDLGGYFPLSFQGRWSSQGFVSYAQAPSIDFGSPELRLMDLNGDGIVDALRTGANFELFFSDPDEGWSAVEIRPRQPIELFPDLNFSDPQVKLGDMTGDSLQDFILVSPGRIDYWPYLGHGQWGRRVTMENSPLIQDPLATGLGFDPSRFQFGDIDGDGLDDIVYVESGRITLWINQSGNRWSDPIVIHNTPATTNDPDDVRLADILGNGASGVLWTADRISPTDDTYKFMDLSGGTNPYLLNEMNNGMGSITRLGYAPSSKFYLADLNDPNTRWKTPLPSPIQVVERVESIDEISKSKQTTQYRYHHGYWDGAEKEFRGFGMVEQFDTETFDRFNEAGLIDDSEAFQQIEAVKFSPPAFTKTWFHLGPIGEEIGERFEADFTGEYWPEDPPLLERSQEMVAFLQNLSAAQRADALRSLSGTQLRTEQYALDESPLADRPYIVTEMLFEISEVSPPVDPNSSRRRIFFPHLRLQRTTQWERGDDPMTNFGVTDDYDEFGQPQRKMEIACPRGWRTLADRPGSPYLVTNSRLVYARPVNNETYIMDRVASITNHEIVNDGSQMLDELRTLPDQDPSLKVIGQTLHFYDGPVFTGRSFGEIGERGAKVRSETLVLTKLILDEAYPSSDPALPSGEAPPYFAHQGSPEWPDDYPSSFTSTYPTDQHSDSTRPGLSITPLGYGFAEGGAGTPFERGYFVATNRSLYDFQQSNAGQRGLLITMRDPLGRDSSDRDTIIIHDEFGFLPAAVTDPVGNVTRANYDYRVMQAREITDTNDNRTLYGYSPLGLLSEKFTLGKEGEVTGDQNNQPGARHEYDFLAFVERGQPIFMRTIEREHHSTENDVPQPERDEIIETVEYFDGLGRPLQTRTRAEDILFGDSDLNAPLFGDGGLPADQSDAAGTSAAVVGRERNSAAPPNVVVSEWQFYDNKGQVIEKFDPFFSTGFEYLSPEMEQSQFQREVLTRRLQLRYDPRGKLIRTIHPDGSEMRTILGVPGSLLNSDLSTPDVFEPTPWENFSYDANDLAPLSETLQPGGATFSLIDRAPVKHHFTPVSIVVDSLGRTIETIERNGSDPTDNWFTTRSDYDIRGNVLTVTDALERTTFRYVSDLTDNLLRMENIDAGFRRTILDAAGNEIERRDGKGALVLQIFDPIHRPTHQWARDDDLAAVTLSEHQIYGDDPNLPLAADEVKAANLRGRPHQQYDEAGRLTFEQYDFKGNILEKNRQVIHDDRILSVFPSQTDPNPDWNITPFQVDWEPPTGTSLDAHAATILNPTEYRTSLTYDALNRVKSIRYPLDVDGARKEIRSRFNRASNLEQVLLDDSVMVEHIAYNASGQRILATLGNGVMSRYTYDPQNLRLARLRSETYTKTGPVTYTPDGTVLQDFAYDYDLSGNIIAINDRTPNCGIPNSLLGMDALDRIFTYDAIFRLTSATGRACAGPPPTVPGVGNPRCQDATLTRGYSEIYSYNAVGNMTRLRHIAQLPGNTGGFTRDFDPQPGSNQIDRMTIGNNANSPLVYSYDANGNMTGETASRLFDWDHSDQIRAFRNQAGDSEPSIHAHYLYDAAGQRVKKVARRQGGGVETTVYVDDIFEHHHWRTTTQTEGQNNSIHVLDDEQRIALVRIGPAHPDDQGPTVQYFLSDHLNSTNVVVGGDNLNDKVFINREEATPFGETSFGSYSKKKYRFAGKERDEESGLSYQAARYYSPQICRWLSVDPAGAVDEDNLYVYVSNSPINYADPNGQEKNKCDGKSKRKRRRSLKDKTIRIDILDVKGKPKMIDWNVINLHDRYEVTVEPIDRYQYNYKPTEHNTSQWKRSPFGPVETKESGFSFRAKVGKLNRITITHKYQWTETKNTMDPDDPDMILESEETTHYRETAVGTGVFSVSDSGKPVLIEVRQGAVTGKEIDGQTDVDGDSRGKTMPDSPVAWEISGKYLKFKSVGGMRNFSSSSSRAVHTAEQVDTLKPGDHFELYQIQQSGGKVNRQKISNTGQ